MSEEIKAFYKKFEEDTGKMQKLTPNMFSGFSGLFQKVMSEGALSVQQKELIALAIGVAVRCEPCIVLHVKKALGVGATKEDILEAASVAAMMGGGPVVTHVPVVIDALEANGAL